MAWQSQKSDVLTTRPPIHSCYQAATNAKFPENLQHKLCQPLLLAVHLIVFDV